MVGGLIGEPWELFSDVYKKGFDGKMEVKISNPVEYFSSLLQLQEQGKADVKIVCQDGFVFSAHKEFKDQHHTWSRSNQSRIEIQIAG